MECINQIVKAIIFIHFFPHLNSNNDDIFTKLQNEETPEFSRKYISWNDQNPPPHWGMNLAEELRPHEFSTQMGKIQVKMIENLKKLTDVR